MQERPGVEEMYCAEQIEIPVSFPCILKFYAKSAIRTQPYDLLRWTSAYFRALANGEVPPVKKRLEYPPLTRPSGITPGYLKILLDQFNQSETLGIEKLLARWRGVDLPESTLYRILIVGDFVRRDCPLLEFLAIGCGFLGNNLFETMVHVCEILTEEPEGGSAMIPLKRFIQLYTFLAGIHCSDSTDSRRQSLGDYHTDEGEAPSTSGEDRFPDPSKLALPGSRRGSEFFNQNSSSETDTSISRCPSDCNVVHRCETEPGSRGALVGDKSDPPCPRGNRFSNSDEEIRTKSGEDSYKDDAADRVDDPGAEEVFELFKGYGDPEDEAEECVADMETYEPIGLENLLEGVCECLETADEKSAESTAPPDPVEEFFDRMRAAFPPGHGNLSVPGIGPTVPEDRVTAVCLWLTDCARRQNGLVGPRNIRHFLCPPLELRPGYEVAEETLFKCL